MLLLELSLAAFVVELFHEFQCLFGLLCDVFRLGFPWLSSQLILKLELLQLVVDLAELLQQHPFLFLDFSHFLTQCL